MTRAILHHRRDLIGLLAAAILVPLAALSWAPRAAHGDISQAEAVEVVNALAADVWSTINRTDLTDQERVDILAGQLAAKTNLDLLGRLVLGRYWRQLDEQQQARYQALFGDVVMRTLAGRLDQFAKDAGGTLQERFAVASSAPAGKQDILVRSTVRPESGEVLSVDWRLREGDDGPVIIDVIIEGVSLLVSQRSEFASVIERSSMEGLLTELEARAASTSS